MKLKAISLFSGAGGDTLGMKLSGIDVVAFSEFDKDCIATHKKNFPKCKLIGEDVNGDITKTSNEEFLSYKNIDIIFGGFPCQSFSHGGKKDPTDSRGFLYQEFVRVVNLLKPKLFIGENVKGILTRKMENGELFIHKIIEEFGNCGYDIKCDLFNMKNYGIPQDRQRVLIYGIRKNMNLKISLGNVVSSEVKYNKDILTFSLEKALKIEKKDIINLIPKNKFIKNLRNSSKPKENKVPTNLIKCYTNNDFSFGKRKKPHYSCIIDISDFSRTILSSYGRMPRLFVPIKNKLGVFLRPYTISELQQIQGFPKNFVFCGKYLSQVKQIGNAIPPKFIHLIMNYVQDIFNNEIIEM